MFCCIFDHLITGLLSIRNVFQRLGCVEMCIHLFILQGCWMLESDWLTDILRCAIIFRVTHVVPGSFLDRITDPFQFAKWFLIFQRSYNRKIIKTHNDIGQTNKYSKQKYKIDSSCPCLATKLRFIMYGKHIAYSLSPALCLSLTDTHIVCTHLIISTNVISTTLMILSVT